jgi:hypothetical protein
MASKQQQEAEKAFVTDYPDFGAQARLIAIRTLAQQYISSSDLTQKQLLHLLAFEQFAMLMEAFEGWFQAILDRAKRPIVQSLRKDFNPANLISHLEARTPENVFDELQIDLSRRSPQEQEEIRKRFLDMIEGVKRLSRHNKEFLIPVYNALKHKFLVHRDEQGNLVFVLDPDRLRKISERYPTFKPGPGMPQSLDYLVDIAKRLTAGIEDLASIRLLEINP